MQATTSKSLSGAAQTLQGPAALDGGNGRLATTSNKLMGLSNAFEGFGKPDGLLGGASGNKQFSRSLQDLELQRIFHLWAQPKKAYLAKEHH